MKPQNLFQKSLVALSLITALAAGSQAFAGPGDAGGGNAVVCKEDDGSVKAQVLDYYEAKLLNDITIDLGAANLTYQQKVDVALNRLAEVDLGLSNTLKKSAEEFYKSTAFIEKARLEPVPDSKHIFIPEGCDISQIAVQIQREYPGQKIYYVNKKIWDLMDSDSKAGLVLHEIIYRNAIAGGATDSKGARFMNSVISSADKFGELTYQEYTDVARKTKLKSGDSPSYYQGYVFPTGSITYHKSGEPLSVLSAQNEVRKFDGKEYQMPEKSKVVFYDNGKVKAIEVVTPPGPLMTKFIFRGITYNVSIKRDSSLQTRMLQINEQGHTSFLPILKGELEETLVVGEFGFTAVYIANASVPLLTAASFARDGIEFFSNSPLFPKVTFGKDIYCYADQDNSTHNRFHAAISTNGFDFTNENEAGVWSYGTSYRLGDNFVYLTPEGKIDFIGMKAARGDFLNNRIPCPELSPAEKKLEQKR